MRAEHGEGSVRSELRPCRARGGMWWTEPDIRGMENDVWSITEYGVRGMENRED